MSEITSPKDVEIGYTNYEGKRSTRIIRPSYAWFGESEYHKDGPQWFWRALDVSRDVTRDFAMKDIHSWSPPSPSKTEE